VIASGGQRYVCGELKVFRDTEGPVFQALGRQREPAHQPIGVGWGFTETEPVNGPTVRRRPSAAVNVQAASTI
jgi:hypothetical protein